MPEVKCASCGVINDTDRAGGYCEECGKRLPSGSAFRVGFPDRAGDTDRDAIAPHRRDDPDVRSGGWDEDYPDVRRRGEQSEEQKNAARGVSGVLFAIAALQLICGAIGLFAVPQAVGAAGGPPAILAVMMGMLIFVAALFAGLGVWARYMPLAAGIVGLLVYVAIALLDLAGAPEMASRGIIFKLIIVFILVRAIIAAGRAR